MRRPGRFILFLISFGVLAGVSVFSFLYSEAGLRWTLKAMASYTPVELSLGEVQGRLAGPVNLKHVRYKNEDISITIGELNFDWQPRRLLAGKLHFSLLEADKIQIDITAQQPSQQDADNIPIKLVDISLPVAIDLERLTLSNVMVRDASQDKAYRLTRLTAALSYNRQTVLLRELDVEAPQLSLSAKGRLEPMAHYPLAFSAAYTVKPNDYPVISGDLEVSGKLDQLEIKQNISTPVRTALTGTVKDVLSRPVWNVNLEITHLEAAELNPQWESLRINGNVATKGSLDGFAVLADLRADYRGEQLHANLDAQYDHEIWKIVELALNLPQQETQLDIQGEVIYTSTRQQLNLSGVWQNITWPLQGENLLSSRDGQIRVSGSLDDYRFEIDGHIKGPEIPPGRWLLAGTGAMDGVELKQLQGDVLGGQLIGRSDILWAPELQWRFNAEGKTLDPGGFWDGLPERLNFVLQGNGSFRDGQYAANVRLENLSGALKEIPITAQGSIGLDQQRISVSPLVVTAGASHLVVSGELDEQWAMSWRMDSPDLQPLYPPVTGRLESSGSISGPRSSPALSMVIKGNELGYKDQQVENAFIKVDWDPADQRESNLAIHLVNIETSGQHVNQLDIQGVGRASQHTIDVWADATWAQLTGRIMGAYQEGGWEGGVSGLRLNLPPAGIWTSTDSAMIKASADHATLKPWCLENQEKGRFCVDASWLRDAGGQGNILIENIPLAMAENWLPPDVSANGMLNLKAYVEQTADGKFSGDAELISNEGALDFEVTRDNIVNLKYTDLIVSSRLQNGIANFRVAADLGEKGHLDGHLQAPIAILDPDTDQITGKFEASLREFGMLSLLVPDAENVQGDLQVDIGVDGPIDKPEINLDLAFTEGSVALPAQGITVDNITFYAQSEQEGVFDFTGGAHSGPGKIQVSGSLTSNQKSDWGLSVAIQGDRFEALNVREYRVLVSPDLNMELNHDSALITGVVFIPEADLRPKTFSGAVRPTSDAIIMTDSEATTGGFAVTSIVRIELGERVRVDGFGLKGRFAGNIVVTDIPGQLTSGAGELRVMDGAYKAYGQNLIIERGRLVFVGGPVDNPGLDIRAIREVNDVTVGLNVSGSLVEPRLVIFSDPAMSETEALSYLLLGRPLERDDTGKDNELSGAALALGVGGASLFGKTLSESMGIDEFGLETKSGTGEIQLKVGTYLSPRLYVGYGRSLVEQVNTFLVRYSLSKSFSVEGESSSEAVGADLLYTIEKN